MKDIISGDMPFKLTKDILYVDVPYFDELKPEKIIEALKIQQNKALWS